jgi:hypothetical protein
MTLLLVGCFVSSAAAVAAAAAGGNEQRQQWIVQTRAADAIGEVLMTASERAESQLERMRQQLATRDEAPAPTAATAPTAPMTTNNSPATRQSQAAYRALFEKVMAEASRGGAGEADPAMENLADAQLFNEMAALQSYNLRTFRRLGELREQATDLRKRLEASGKWKGDVTTRPSIESPDDLARESLAALKRDASPRWAEARQKMRNAIATASNQQRRNAISTPPSLHAPPVNGGGGGGGVNDDPRFQRYYYGTGETFTGWGGEMYQDPFNFHGGGGTYLRTDTRVNADYDARTQGQSDRRVNVTNDRRVNVHVDPRENF